MFIIQYNDFSDDRNSKKQNNLDGWLTPPNKANHSAKKQQQQNGYFVLIFYNY